MLFIIFLSYIFLIGPLLEARAEVQKYFRWFLVQMKSLEFAFEINWPLARQIKTVFRHLIAPEEKKLLWCVRGNKLLKLGRSINHCGGQTGWFGTVGFKRNQKKPQNLMNEFESYIIYGFQNIKTNIWYLSMFKSKRQLSSYIFMFCQL